MALRTSWFNQEKGIILYEFEGEWTWVELSQMIQQAEAMAEPMNTPIYTIVDLTRNQMIPSGALSHFRGGTAKAPENWKGAVFVGANMFVRSLVATFAKVYPRLGQRYKTAEAREEAEAMIIKMQSGDG